MSQVTSHQLQLQQEADKKAQQAAAEEAAKAKKKVVSEDAYSQMVDTQNVNRNANDVEARSVTAALSALGVKEEEDKHPERYIPCDNRLAELLMYWKNTCMQCCSARLGHTFMHVLGHNFMLSHTFMHIYACSASSSAVLVYIDLQANESSICSV